MSWRMLMIIAIIMLIAAALYWLDSVIIDYALIQRIDGKWMTKEALYGWELLTVSWPFILLGVVAAVILLDSICMYAYQTAENADHANIVKRLTHELEITNFKAAQAQTDAISALERREHAVRQKEIQLEGNMAHASQTSQNANMAVQMARKKMEEAEAKVFLAERSHKNAWHRSERFKKKALRLETQLENNTEEY